MKQLVCLTVILSVCSLVFAMPITYKGNTINIESFVGTGSNQTMIVVDWGMGTTQSHAWLYKYDGSKVVADALDAIAGVCNFAWSQAAFVQYVNYDHGIDKHATINLGWLSFWNKDDGDWAMNNFGVYDQMLINGGFSGIVADDFPEWGDIGPQIPQIPEPATLFLVIGGLILARKK